MVTIPTDDPRAVAAVEAIQTGDTEGLKRLLQEYPKLATARLGTDQMTRTLLHVVTDWPGHFPNGAASVHALVDAGADVNARFGGPHTETPLHWAASSDDVEVLDALLDAGADIETPGAVIGGGTPLADATAFGQWNAARRLIERNARSTLWESATLGLMDRVVAFFASAAPPGSENVTHAFWGACHGGQRASAEYLLERGADINWVGWDDLTPLDAARRSEAGDLVSWLRENGARPAADFR
ncbi:MAG: ankyrin repeat domain-containing protein [Acidimicrobiales bacterium]